MYMRHVYKVLFDVFPKYNYTLHVSGGEGGWEWGWMGVDWRLGYRLSIQDRSLPILTDLCATYTVFIYLCLCLFVYENSQFVCVWSSRTHIDAYFEVFIIVVTYVPS